MNCQISGSKHLNGVFDLVYAGQVISSSIPFDVDVDTRPIVLSSGYALNQSDYSLVAESQSDGLHVLWEAKQISDGAVWEFQLEVENKGESPITLTRIDSAALKLEGGPWIVESFASAWGDEFRSQTGTTRHDSFFDVRSGRSSHGQAPLVYFTRESDGFTVIISPAWSGNWHVDVFAGGWLRAGISTWNFELALTPGRKVQAPSVVVAAGESKVTAQRELQSAIRDNWIARTGFTDQIPIEWNHWWPYEDVEVNEAVILENLAIAKEMPVDAIVVDAGWFGESDLETNWVDLRGDWSSVNLARFPSDLKELGQAVKGSGLKPGIWIEIEAVGAKSKLRSELPEAMARNDLGDRADPSYRVGTVSLDLDDPGFLGYVCLGSEAGWQHCFDSIKTVVGSMGAQWLKVDFNIDPGRGCTRTDHGHGSMDGLFWHYQGLYRLLDRVREFFPELIIEACSSGGLRIDLGLAKHVHCFFLSDPDYTEHHLQALWGAAQMLPPLGILHWPWSWWRNGYEPSQLDFHSLEVETFDVMVRSAMFHRIGISYPLPLMPERLAKRLKHHLEVYKAHIAPMLAKATLQPLTDSPTRAGGGVRFPALQLSAEVGSNMERHLVFAAALEPGLALHEFTIDQLQPDEHYVVTDFETGGHQEVIGREINAKLLTELTQNARSWICELRLKKVKS